MKNKRMVLLAVFALIATAGFARDDYFEKIRTADGYYNVSIEYLGKNRREPAANNWMGALSGLPDTLVTENIKLTKGQWECVNKMLEHFEIEPGDSFYIEIRMPNNTSDWGQAIYMAERVMGNSSKKGVFISFYCDFTTKKDFIYSIFRTAFH